MSLHCSCPDWEPELKKINGPIVLQSVRSGGAYRYNGKQFIFCPWCGERLTGTVEAGLEVPAMPRPEPEANTCRTCGKKTFGLYCAEHSPFTNRVVVPSRKP
jgi:hypothetical protein